MLDHKTSADQPRGIPSKKSKVPNDFVRCLNRAKEFSEEENFVNCLDRAIKVIQ